MKADYIIRQGEELSLSLIATEGDISNVTSVQAVLKAAGPNGTVPPITAPTLATFLVEPVSLPDIGWKLVVSGVTTATLKPGYYVTNAKLNLATGGPLKTDEVLIEIRASVT